MVIMTLQPSPAAALTPTITEFSAGLNPGADTNLGITAGPDGNVWFTDRGTPKAIGRITPTGAITEFSSGLNPGSIPEAITAGPDGNLWFTDRGTPAAIGRITPGGTITEFSAGLNAGSGPVWITAGSDGNLWFTDNGTTKAIGRITPGGTITEFSSGLNMGTQLSSITLGADGNVWFGDTGSTPEIGRVTPAGAITELSVAGTGPYGLVAGPDGNLWFTDSNCPPARIGQSTLGGTSTLFSAGLNADSCPYFIAAGADASMWFTDEGSSTVAIGNITTAGAIGLFTAGLSGGSLPYGITGGPDGNVWFTDTGTPQAIGRITTPPAVTTGGASVLGAGAATVNGIVNGHSQPTTSKFEYGPSPAYGESTAAAGAGSGSSATDASGTLTGLKPSTTYHYRATATNPTGNSFGSDATFTTLALPTVRSVRVVPNTWRQGSQLPKVSRRKRARVGTRISFTLSRAVPVRLQFFAERPGRKIGKNCRRATRRNRRSRKCTLFVPSGSFSFSGHPGKNKVRFQGRVSKSKRLRTGRYRVKVIAADPTVAQTSSRTARFRIVRR